MARPSKSEQLTVGGEPIPTVEEQLVHLDAVLAARRDMPTAGELAGMVEIFGALADPTRLRIIAALATRELCVLDLAAAIGLSQSAVSHQLRVLRDRGLVRARRAGRRAYYRLDDDHVETLFRQARDHAGHLDEAVNR
ncbi:MAG TPA: metalloregulator ArsR/SmtB family transcription factor [Thermomicrobiales bacterium]|nr:metalloregulator ArsR/SmtB family transcription factor [Thermomicrobiales bacterium]